MSLGARIGKGILVNGFGQAVTILGQLIILPTLLIHWGAEQYGAWIILSVIPQYLALSDMGFSSVAGNEIAMALGRKDPMKAKNAFRGALVANIVACIAVIFLTCLLIILQSQFQILPIHGFREDSSVIILLIFGIQVCLTFFQNCSVASFRGGGQYPYGAFLNNVQRLTEIMATVSSALLGGSPIVVALSVLIVRIIFVIGMFRQLAVRFEWARFVLSKDGLLVARRLIRPCLGYMALPASVAVSQSGSVMLIGYMFGPLQVIVFTAMRTLARLLVQLSTAINSPIVPEISSAYASENMPLVRKLHAAAMRAALFIGMLVGASMIWLAPFIFDHWTKGKVVFDINLFIPLLIAVILNMLWGTSAIVLLAVNLHTRFTLWALIFSIFGLAACYVIAKISGSLSMAAYGLAWQELIMLIIVLRSSLKLISQNRIEFLSSIFLVKMVNIS
ncbi:hypothetical protein [Burkholderia sp. BCC1993]|uniref:lipopolysaccharide biosynthesis protein n=1 Tax=Burkholderia sp. BCC1993 TaxID=2817444 RepID=UPI002AAFE28D|nr:hypothetical protein [Burkholderia sp. BCC1993]